MVFRKLLETNDDKCHLMMFDDKCCKATVTIGNSTVNESEYEKLLGITFDDKVSFRKHVEGLSKNPTKNPMVLLACPPISILSNWKFYELFL